MNTKQENVIEYLNENIIKTSINKQNVVQLKNNLYYLDLNTDGIKSELQSKLFKAAMRIIGPTPLRIVGAWKEFWDGNVKKHYWSLKSVNPPLVTWKEEPWKLYTDEGIPKDNTIPPLDNSRNRLYVNTPRRNIGKWKEFYCMEKYSFYWRLDLEDNTKIKSYNNQPWKIYNDDGTKINNKITRQNTRKRKNIEEEIQENNKKIKKEEEEELLRPNEHYCPISNELMDNPYIIVPCGHSFNYNNITHWLRSNNTCPNCRLKVEPRKAYPNITLKNIINDWKK